MSKQIALEIFNEIKKKNEMTNIDSIPHSDDFIHNLNISIGIEPSFARQIINALIDSHKIFAIEIVGEDKKNNIPRVEGYVECDLKTLRRLKLYFQDELIRLYETEHYKRITYHQVIKEIMPIMNTLNNTPIGQIANKAIMMGELERMMEKNYEEYTEEWKNRHFDIEINRAISGSISKESDKKKKKDNELSDEIIIEDRNVPKLKKTGDFKNYIDIIPKTKNYPLERILKIYGIDFFLKAQIRRHQFVYLTDLVDGGKFLNNSDLLLLRDMLYNIKKNINSDSKLLEMREDIFGLERAITHKLYFGNNNLT